MHVDTPITVRYGETDMMGVVYHANYLLYFEDARVDFLKRIGFSYNERLEKLGYMSPIVACEIKYNAPLAYGEEGFVRTTIAKTTAMKTVYHQRVFRAGDDPATVRPLVEAFLTLCIVERDTFKPVSIKKTVPDLYEKYVAYSEPPDGPDDANE